MWYLIAVAWLGLIVGLIWYYKRKSDEQATRAAKRLDVMLSEIKPGPQLANEPASEIARPGARAGLRPVSPPARAMRKSPLSDQARLLYYIFKVGMPDHLLFINLKLGDVIAFDTKATVSHPTAGLLNQKLDLVVCSKDLQPVAAVVFGDGGAANLAAAGAAHLASAGIRLIYVDLRQPPHHGQIKGLVYGNEGERSPSR